MAKKSTPVADKVILGIDPGTILMGYGVIAVSGHEVKLVSLGTIDLSKLDGHAMKLKKIFERTTFLLEEYKPDEVALEAPFFGKNVQSMLKLGRAQGVAMSAALSRNIPIYEYQPRKVKQSITGNGNAGKEQVAAMLQTLLSFKELPKYFDATDGLAVALCHHFQNGSVNNGKKNYSGWKSFVDQNSNKIIDR